METGCPHPESAIVTIETDMTVVWWCSLCGSIEDNNGEHGAPACTWRAPTGIVLPGWMCACGVFNGSLKELLATCRLCGTPRLTTDTTNDTSGMGGES
jgi:hypothetical protein